jgi:hypothetical protein
MTRRLSRSAARYCVIDDQRGKMGTMPLLVDTTWLAAHLDDPDLRILDSTTNVIREPGKHDRVVAERAKFEAGHIPGAQFVDLQADLSDQHRHLNFTAPSANDFARAIERFGISDDSRVVVYGTGVSGGRRGSGGCFACSASTMPPCSTVAGRRGPTKTGRSKPGQAATMSEAISRCGRRVR